MIVFDEDTGKYKRLWGAYGNKPTDEKAPPRDPAAVEDEGNNGPRGTLTGYREKLGFCC